MDYCGQLAAALRRINRVLDIQSRDSERSYGLTSTQCLILREIRQHGALTVGGLAHQISLGQTTVTEIVNRLEQRKLLRRQRATDDRRRVLLTLTAAGQRAADTAPSLLPDNFLLGFNALPAAERAALLAALQQTAGLMEGRGGQSLQEDSLLAPINPESTRTQ